MADNHFSRHDQTIIRKFFNLSESKKLRNLRQRRLREERFKFIEVSGKYI